MNIEQMLSVLDADIVKRLKTAVEIGKWPNGIVLSKEQRETCMQAVLAWEYTHLPEDERTGYIDKGKKKEGDVCDDDSSPRPIRFT
ncbi:MULTISPECIES: YeaC family protein [Acinetobacter]|jgi:uncharacterized protein|uniref:YeaC family protein n=1 Tax=Acinetobacter pollinis TaxID=2605270 RepID=A0ABU6DRC7_9GAMM|nr:MULTISPECIES: DUF1315 family protein [Acinetobacter]MBF7689195.1 YeaC family protein [Acinetobacter pollinis]MBF7691858.1 YeaC family protein [Acinetobacter pollinis]MBF7696740.1 YeaC family protein [Acinetobacter pollinis]MBF7699963.1 YeaC family protein [Acinetobacter pollinis]MEB5476415.1 YeaC family protein [Acinetobacter pollinis]